MRLMRPLPTIDDLRDRGAAVMHVAAAGDRCAQRGLGANATVAAAGDAHRDIAGHQPLGVAATAAADAHRQRSRLAIGTERAAAADRDVQVADVEVDQVDLSRAADRRVEPGRLHRSGGDAARAADGERPRDGRSRSSRRPVCAARSRVPRGRSICNLRSAPAPCSLVWTSARMLSSATISIASRRPGRRTTANGAPRPTPANAPTSRRCVAATPEPWTSVWAEAGRANGSRASPAKARKGRRASLITVYRGSMASMVASRGRLRHLRPTSCEPEGMRCRQARRTANRSAGGRRRYRPSPGRRKRLGGAPTERRTIAEKALGLA